MLPARAAVSSHPDHMIKSSPSDVWHKRSPSFGSGVFGSSVSPPFHAAHSSTAACAPVAVVVRPRQRGPAFSGPKFVHGAGDGHFERCAVWRRRRPRLRGCTRGTDAGGGQGGRDEPADPHGLRGYGGRGFESRILSGALAAGRSRRPATTDGKAGRVSDAGPFQLGINGLTDTGDACRLPGRRRDVRTVRRRSRPRLTRRSNMRHAHR
jgi:hypothetical protein